MEDCRDIVLAYGQSDEYRSDPLISRVIEGLGQLGDEAGYQCLGARLMIRIGCVTIVNTNERGEHHMFVPSGVQFYSVCADP